MDLSEQWRILWHVSSYVLFFAVCVSCFYLTNRIRRGSFRILVAAMGAILLGIGVFSLWFDLAFVRGTRMRGPAIPSPDGKHIALVYWIMVGAVGFDHVHVVVRSRYSPFTEEVFTGLAQAPPNDPTVSWKDSKHLLVSYSENGTTKPCTEGSNHVDDIEVQCQE